MAKAKALVSKHGKLWLAIGGAVCMAFGLGLLADSWELRSPIDTGSEEEVARHPRPAEFLYLDSERVAAYLAQLDGGIAKSERLSETLTREDKGSVSGGDFFQVGASAQRQSFVEREVTPTATASFFRLHTDLLQEQQLRRVSAANFRDFADLGEGTFVSFSTSDIRTPIYANSYLVVRQSGTLSALFPTAGAHGARRAAVMAERAEARGYAHQVGPNPRIVFALTPRKESDGPEADEKVKFLMPIRYRQLTDERSLIKDGGGRFTVVGKLVRVFADFGAGTSYVDSPTLETWRRPLRGAPARLLERSSAKCKAPQQPARRKGGKQMEPKNLPRRKCVLDRLEEQTQIPDRGAVILPIAIYK